MGAGESDWESLGHVARRRDQLAPVLLRGLLGKALRHRGYGAIVIESDEEDGRRSNGAAAILVTIEIIWGLTASASLALGAAWYLWPLVLIFVMVLLGIAGKIFGSPGFLAGVLSAVWIGAGAIFVVGGDRAGYLIAYAVPVALVVLSLLSSRALRLRDFEDMLLALGGLAKSAPLLAPVVVIVLFLPALSRDVWEVAALLSITSLALVGVLAVGLLFVVVRLELGSQIEMTLAERAAALSASGGRSSRTRDELRAALADEDAKLIGEFDDDLLERAWPPKGDEYAAYLFESEGGEFSAPLTWRLLLTVGIVGVFFFAYVYLLTSAVIPGSLASRWSGASLPQANPHLLGVSVTLYGGPYLKLGALLGLIACATFLAFALVEERFAGALATGLLREPGEGFLVLALPYLSLREDQISASLSEGDTDSSGSG